MHGLLTAFIILIIYKSIIKPLYKCDHKWRYVKQFLIEELQFYKYQEDADNKPCIIDGDIKFEDEL